MSIKIIGGESFKLKLDAMEKRVIVNVKRAVDDSAEMIRGDAKILAPEDTTALSTSIDKRVDQEDGNNYVVRVGPADLESGVPGMPYPFMVETGKGRGGAQPFLRPAFDANKRAVKQNVSAAIKDALR